MERCFFTTHLFTGCNMRYFFSTLAIIATILAVSAFYECLTYDKQVLSCESLFKIGTVSIVLAGLFLLISKKVSKW